jgi:oxalate decarboxylase
MSTTAHEPSSNAAQVVSSPTPENLDLSRQNPNSNFPPSTDKGDVGAIWYSTGLAHKRITGGGWTHQVTQLELPTSKDLAGVNMRWAAGAYRELHWHSADERAYMLYGNARLSVMQPDGTMYINDVTAGDL